MCRNRSHPGPTTISFEPRTIVVPAHGTADLIVMLDVAAAGVGNSSAFREVSGVVLFAPATFSDNGNTPLRVPYFMACACRAPGADRVRRIGFFGARA